MSGVALILIRTAHSRFRDHNRVLRASPPVSCDSTRLDSIVAPEIDRVLAKDGRVLRSVFRNRGEIKVRYTCEIGGR